MHPIHHEFTKLELVLMQALWKLEQASVADVQIELRRELAYATIQTVLNILERKGKVQRVRRGRAYIYSALVTEEHARMSAVQKLVEEMFGGSYENLLTLLIRKVRPDRWSIIWQ